MISLIILDAKCAGARSAGNPHAACDVAGAGDGAMVSSIRARRGKPWIQTRACPDGLPRQLSTLPHICGTKVNGQGFQLRRETRRKRMKAKIREVKDELRRHMHASIDEQGRWLNSVLRGHYAYFAVPTNSAALSAFRHHLIVRWIRRLRRRSQRHRMTWARMQKYVDRYLPRPRILHPWPEQRFRVKYSR